MSDADDDRDLSGMTVEELLGGGSIFGLFGAALQWLKSRGLELRHFDPSGSGHFVFDANGRAVDVIFRVRESQQQVVVRAQFPIKCAEEHRRELMEFLTRANWGTVIGNFELDLGDGEVRYKSSVDIEGTEFTPTVFGNLVASAAFTLTTYYDALEAVCSGRQSAVEAIAMVEG